MIKKASRALDISENLFASVAALLVIISTVSVIFEVFSRALFNVSYTWVHEINEYILLYIPFLTAAWLLRYNEHIVVDLIEEVIPSRLKFVLDMIVGIIGIFVCAVLVWFGMLATLDFFVNGVRSQTNLGVPQAYIAVIIPLGSLLFLFEFIRSLYQKISPKR
ncbi:TRAP transporter small permease [Alteribacillus iranensis]|uniref:TRAP-type C4-dicarboxylate transport system, small permease component n=1 Tax=Alteribacillus iranensis TaxID=930128 RepID=A0A1I2E9A9_9BACI|nr:TRAP transporter small permease [Alteribacillus iranensis]SFE89435.1 TRAP-type C4-dicarboxylate transport system, small permease component [Alteribacillus iranensis]